MTLGLFFTHTYDPTVNFPFNFLNFHSDTLISHLLFLCFNLMHSFAICYFLSPPFVQTTPPTTQRSAHHLGRANPAVTNFDSGLCGNWQ